MSNLILASPEWIERIKDLLTELVAQNSSALAGVDFTLSETFTKVPPDEATTFWAAHIIGGTVVFLDAPKQDADFALVTEQEAAMVGSRLIYQNASQPELDAAAAHRQAMMAAGRMTATGGTAGAPKPLLRVLRRLHDTIARETR